MRKNHKLTAALLALALLVLTCVSGMSAFASEDDVTVDTVEEQSTAAVVSGCDLKEENLVRAKVKQYGLSMLVPKDNLITIDSDSEVFAASDYSRSYFMEQGCVLYSYTQNANYCSVTVFVSEQDSIYDYYGDYSKLSEDKRKELVADSSDENSTAEFVTINGRGYIQVTASDSSTGDEYTQYKFTTVLNHKEYVIYIQTLNANADDKAVLNQMIGSINLTGEGMKLSSADVMLLVICVILCIAVAVVYFFFYRATQFAKLGVTNFPRIGFDLPKANSFDTKEVLDEMSEDEDDFDDEEDEEEDDEEDDDADERIIKD